MSSTPRELARSEGSLFARYSGRPELYDESLSANAELRDHWQRFGATLQKLGAEELSLRAENARRVIREHGITYNVYSDPQGMDRPWELDIVPLLISADEWRILERGLIQRATLLNLILIDLFGPQELLRTGALPPALVFGNPAFLRPCHGVRVPKNIYLHL